MLRSLAARSLAPAAGLAGAARLRLLSTLALLERAGGELSPASLATLTAAKQLGGPVTALLAGSDAAAAAASVAKSPAVDKVLVAAAGAYDHALPEPLAVLVAELVKKDGYTHVVAPASAVGRNVLPRAGAILDVQPVADVVEIVGEDMFVRPIYAGNALATVKALDSPKLLTVRATGFEAAALDGGNAAVEDAPTVDAPTPAEFVSENLVKSERPDLNSASRVVSGGRGLKNKENFDSIMNPFADALGAAVGASRAAVDSGYADNSQQVGQTGKVVAPELYVAVGISGAIQHLAGMKDSKVIAAINKDEDAAIFHVADVGLVADLFEAVPEITKKVSA